MLIFSNFSKTRLKFPIIAWELFFREKFNQVNLLYTWLFEYEKITSIINKKNANFWNQLKPICRNQLKSNNEINYTDLIFYSVAPTW